jgi:aspartyl-tRNA(Asn)/glutamyl-tRNA(Gln) amidotransferase subunit B
MSKYETVIGLEVHVELATNTKIFCGCSTSFGAPPNTQTCPICLGHPGVLPVLNKQAVNFAMKAAMALNCQVAEDTKFDRKNYFYPDSPKAYQISQFDKPIGEHGWIDIEVDGETKRIGITRLHLEEDAGKLTHDGDASLVDFNRVGVPLIEIVSEPDLRSPKEAKAYLEKIKSIIQYTGVSDVKMEEGSLRCDANISLRLVGAKQFGTKTELKNLNSFRNVERALEFEEIRQAEVLDDGDKVIQQTRWSEELNTIKIMRSKEEAHDYRYFPEPDLVRLKIDETWKQEIQAQLPELPDKRVIRYKTEFGLPSYDAGVLTSSRVLADFFEDTVSKGADPKLASNWLLSDVLGYLNSEGLELKDTPLTSNHLAEMITLIQKGTISSKIAKDVLKEMLATGHQPSAIVEEKGWVQISDEGALKTAVADVLSANPAIVEELKGGRDKVLGFLVGQVMKATKGKANPQLVNQLIREQVGS